jgi:hypothetical protein
MSTERSLPTREDLVQISNALWDAKAYLREVAEDHFHNGRADSGRRFEAVAQDVARAQEKASRMVQHA